MANANSSKMVNIFIFRTQTIANAIQILRFKTFGHYNHVMVELDHRVIYKKNMELQFSKKSLVPEVFLYNNYKNIF